MEEGALLRLDARARLDAKEGSPQYLVKASLRRPGSIATLNFALHNQKSFSPESERFAEGLLRFVMLVAVAFVKLVRALAHYIRSNRHALAAVFPRPVLGSGQQSRARSQAALPFRDHKPIHFRANIAFKERVSAHV